MYQRFLALLMVERIADSIDRLIVFDDRSNRPVDLTANFMTPKQPLHSNLPAIMDFKKIQKVSKA